MVLVGHSLITSRQTFADTNLWRATWVQALAWPVHFGGAAVIAFLGVSGFSLAWSELCRRESGQAATTPGVFALRRAARILPVYYPAVLLGLITVRLLDGTSTLRLPIFSAAASSSWGGVVSHLLLVHNARPEWLLQGNSVLWTLAYEVQLYAFFAVMLRLALSRSGRRVLILALLLALTLAYGYPQGGLVAHGYLVNLAAPFTAGVITGTLAFQRDRQNTKKNGQNHCRHVGHGLLLVLVVLPATVRYGCLHDVLWTVDICLLMTGYTTPVIRDREWLAGPRSRWLGARSYGVYAFHFPIVMIWHFVLVNMHVSGTAQPFLIMLATAAVTLGAASCSLALVEERAQRLLRHRLAF